MCYMLQIHINLTTLTNFEVSVGTRLFITQEYSIITLTSISLHIKRSPVRFPVGAHAWDVGPVPVRACMGDN